MVCDCIQTRTKKGGFKFEILGAAFHPPNGRRSSDTTPLPWRRRSRTSSWRSRSVGCLPTGGSFVEPNVKIPYHKTSKNRMNGTPAPKPTLATTSTPSTSGSPLACSISLVFVFVQNDTSLCVWLLSFCYASARSRHPSAMSCTGILGKSAVSFPPRSERLLRRACQ